MKTLLCTLAFGALLFSGCIFNSDKTATTVQDGGQKRVSRIEHFQNSDDSLVASDITTYTYDDNDRIVEILQYIDYDMWDSTKIEFTYNSSDLPDEVSFSNFMGTEWTLNNKSILEYTGGRLQTVTQYTFYNNTLLENDIYEYSYLNNLIVSENRVFNTDSSFITYEHAQGLLTKKIIDHHGVDYYVYDYDQHGRVVAIRNYSGEDTLLQRDSIDYTDSQATYYNYTYDGNSEGRLYGKDVIYFENKSSNYETLRTMLSFVDLTKDLFY